MAMVKTTLYLPESVKRGIERVAHDTGVSEAEFIRRSLERSVEQARPAARFGVVELASSEPIDWNTDDHLAGFGER